MNFTDSKFDYLTELTLSIPFDEACDLMIPYLQSPLHPGEPSSSKVLVKRPLSNGLVEVTSQGESDLNIYHLSDLGNGRTHLIIKTTLPVQGEQFLAEDRRIAEVSFHGWAAGFEAYCLEHPSREL